MEGVVAGPAEDEVVGAVTEAAAAMVVAAPFAEEGVVVVVG